MHYNTKSNNVCADKINCCYRVTTVSVFECIEIEKKKALKPLRFKAFFMVGVTGFEPMASWSRSKPIWCIFEFLGQKPLYIVVVLDTNGIKK